MRRKRKKPGILLWLVLILNILFITGLILSYLSVFVDPKDFWPAVLFGLGYPYLITINVIFILVWLMFRRW